MDARYYNGEPEAEHDPNAGGPGVPYVCRSCAWRGRGAEALDHYRATGHRVRGRDWPADWPDAQFSIQIRTAAKRSA